MAHRGASAELPEHTLEGYRLAVQEGKGRAGMCDPDREQVPSRGPPSGGCTSTSCTQYDSLGAPCCSSAATRAAEYLPGAWVQHSTVTAVVSCPMRHVCPGADFIECDVVLSSDLVPHCRHEPNLAATTDALKRFPDRQRTYSIDGEQVAGVFSVDLTAAEMATLRAVQPWPFRNQSYNGRCGVPTLEQYLLVAKVGKGRGGGCCM